MRRLALSIAIALGVGAAHAQTVAPPPGGMTAGSTSVSGCTSLQLFYNNAGSLGCIGGSSWTSASSLLALDGKYQVKNGATSVFESNTSSFTGGNYSRWISTDFFVSFFDTYAHAALPLAESRGVYIDYTKVSTNGYFGLSASGTDAFSPDTFLTRKAAASLQFGRADAAAPVAQTIGPQSVVAGTSNTAGAVFTVRDSAGTGTGASGGIDFQTAAPGASGTAQNSHASAFTIGVIGHGIVQIKKPYTVATLPTCNAAARGSFAMVTDAAASPTYNATVAGGGAVVLPVFCDGANWTNH